MVEYDTRAALIWRKRRYWRLVIKEKSEERRIGRETDITAILRPFWRKNEANLFRKIEFFRIVLHPDLP